MEEFTRIPQHVTIIMDGNGRWAKKQGQVRLFGHNAGIDSVRDCTKYAAQVGVKYLSLFAFSEENWNRPADEVQGLMQMMFKAIVSERNLFHEGNIRFRVIGDMSKLSPDLLESIRGLEQETASMTGMTLIVMLSYSGKWDITQAAARYAQDAVSAAQNGTLLPPLTEPVLAGYLATAGIPDPDLMIRTSGEQRISNYMLWQCAYTEFYFTEVLWPDFRRADFSAALKAYSERDRRYGKVK